MLGEDPRVEVPYADLRWQNFRHKAPEEMHRVVRDFAAGLRELKGML